jgi:hypothetical protein
MMMKGNMKNILANYIPSIVTLPGKDKTAYMELMRKQLTPELAELLIDITVEFDKEILEKLKDNPKRLNQYNTLCAILDGELINA